MNSNVYNLLPEKFEKLKTESRLNRNCLKRNDCCKNSVTFGSTGMYFSLFSSGIEFFSFIKVNSSSIDDMRFTFTIRCYFVVQVNREWLHEIRFVLCVD